MAAIEAPEKLGIRPFHEFDEAAEVWPRGDRIEAIRAGAARFRERFATPENRIRAVQTVNLASAAPSAIVGSQASVRTTPSKSSNWTITSRLRMLMYGFSERAAP